MHPSLLLLGNLGLDDGLDDEAAEDTLGDVFDIDVLEVVLQRMAKLEDS